MEITHIAKGEIKLDRTDLLAIVSGEFLVKVNNHTNREQILQALVPEYMDKYLAGEKMLVETADSKYLFNEDIVWHPYEPGMTLE